MDSSSPPRCGLQHGGSIRLIGLIAAVSLRCSSPVFRSRRVAGPVSPSRSGNGQSRPVTEHRPPAWGQQVLQGDYWVQILGTVHRQPSIQIRCRWNYPVPVPQMNNVLLPRNRACNTVPPALNQRPWSTNRRFTPIRRWAGGSIPMMRGSGSGHRSYRSSTQSAQGTVCRSRSSGCGRFRCWGTIPESGWPWGEAASSCNSTLSRPPPFRRRLSGTIRFLRLIAAFRFRSCRVPQSGQVHMRSRFRFRLMVPQTLQVLLLGNHMGARITLVWRHCPL